MDFYAFLDEDDDINYIVPHPPPPPPNKESKNRCSWTSILNITYKTRKITIRITNHYTYARVKAKHGFSNGLFRYDPKYI